MVLLLTFISIQITIGIHFTLVKLRNIGSKLDSIDKDIK